VRQITRFAVRIKSRSQSRRIRNQVHPNRRHATQTANMMRRRRSKAIVDGSSSRMNICRPLLLLRLRHTLPQEDGLEEGKFPRPVLGLLDGTRPTSNHKDPAARHGNSHGYSRLLLATVATIDDGANDGGQTALALFIVLVGVSFVLGYVMPRAAIFPFFMLCTSILKSSNFIPSLHD
jgi:hypothetical protein